jgi:F-type H+-transporting ATPase subunit gamma
MQTLESLHRHIETTVDLRTIVKTMKTLAAVSIHQYENASAALADYARTVEMGLQVILRKHLALLNVESETCCSAAVILGSDHGLCGRFNEDLVRLVTEQLLCCGQSLSQVPLLVVGAKVAAKLEAQGGLADPVLAWPGSVEGLSETVQSLLIRLDTMLAVRPGARILIFHNRRSDEIAAQPHITQLLPLDKAHMLGLVKHPWPSRCLPTFTMEFDRLFAALVRQHLFVALFKAAAESVASEQASRLLAMQAAERNIDQHLDEVNAEYRMQRQQQITDEIIDVLSGFEAMRSEQPRRDSGVFETAE